MGKFYLGLFLAIQGAWIGKVLDIPPELHALIVICLFSTPFLTGYIARKKEEAAEARAMAAHRFRARRW